MIFLWRVDQSGPLQKIKLGFTMDSQIINMDLQEGTIVQGI
jgi:hypothetical protein